jgi:secondary thiamine-phosphate synthase enzyme
MAHRLTTLSFDTPGAGLHEITADISAWLRGEGIESGLLTLFCQHTSASLLITENASSAVHRDLLRWLGTVAPEHAGYEHADEGPDDMPAHLRAVLTGAGLSIPVGGGRMLLGTWQGVFLAEHRRQPHRRKVVAQVIGG